MSQFILLIRGGNEPYQNATPEEIQQGIERYRQWAQNLRRNGKLERADKLRDGGGKVLHGRNGGVVVDGPFAETKEAIGGYFIVNAASEEEAIAIARECPVYDEGGSIELREIEM